MKESKNLKASSNNILVGLYLSEPFHDGQLSECLYGIANQKHPVDVVILDGGLSEKAIEFLNKTAKKPSLKILKTGEDGNPTEEIVESEKGVEFNLIKTGESAFPKIFNDIFNLAVENKYEAFSMVELGDSLGANWYSVANTYMKENEDVGFFLPMIRSFKNGVLTGFMNEACWAEGLSEEAGKFDMNLLLKFNCANPLAAVYKTEELQEYSEERDGRFYPMKESMKISHYYEFFLRMAYNDIKMMTIPRVGYDFRVDDVVEFRESTSKIPNNISNLPSDKGGVAQEEVAFWVEQSKKEYFFDEDRNKEYEQQPQES